MHSYNCFTVMVGALSAREPLTFRKAEGFLANLARHIFVETKQIKHFFTSKALTDIEKHVHED